MPHKSVVKAKRGGAWSGFGLILKQPPPDGGSLLPLLPTEEERAGERRPVLSNAPHPDPLATRSSRGEGEILVVVSRCARPVVLPTFPTRVPLPHRDLTCFDAAPGLPDDERPARSNRSDGRRQALCRFLRESIRGTTPGRASAGPRPSADHRPGRAGDRFCRAKKCPRAGATVPGRLREASATFRSR